MMATVRNRRAVITAVEPFSGKDRVQIHLVRVEYTDLEGVPEDSLIWEREPGASLL